LARINQLVAQEGDDAVKGVNSRIPNLLVSLVSHGWGWDGLHTVNIVVDASSFARGSIADLTVTKGDFIEVSPLIGTQFSAGAGAIALIGCGSKSSIVTNGRVVWYCRKVIGGHIDPFINRRFNGAAGIDCS